MMPDDALGVFLASPVESFGSHSLGSLGSRRTLPFADDEGPLTCAHDGRLRPTASVYVADSAPWRFLPAKGLTFTLMANARRVADAVIASLERTP